MPLMSSSAKECYRSLTESCRTSVKQETKDFYLKVASYLQKNLHPLNSSLVRNLRVLYPKVSQDLRVFARNSQTFCRRPDSDSDETRSRRSSGPKTKLETPLSTIRAHTWCPGASKVADFCRPKKPFFGQIFFLSNRTQMFAMPFS